MRSGLSVGFFNASIGTGPYRSERNPVGALFMQTANTLKYIGYARKSSEDNKERQAASLPDQAFVIENLKKQLGLNIVKNFEESKSAHTPQQREAFKNMVESIERGEANAIVTWHANRLARNPVDGGYIIFLMDNGKLHEVLTPSRTYKNTPEDKFVLGLEFSLSKKDSDDKSIVVKRGLDKKIRDGWRPGWCPLGYLNDPATKSGERRIYVDTERFPFVKKIFETFLAGTPVTEILRISQDEWHLRTPQKKRMGGKYLSLSEIYAILNNPFYCGKFEYPVGSGNWFENNPDLERAVSEEDFDRVQIKLGNVSQYYTKHNYTYAHTMNCGNCDSGIVVDGKWQVICSKCKTKFQLTKKNKDHCTYCGTLISEMANPKTIHYIYNRCGRKKNRSCRELGVSDKELGNQILSKTDETDISSLFLTWAVEQIEKMGKSDMAFQQKTLEATKTAYKAAQTRLDNLIALKISPSNSDGSLLNDEEFKTRKLALEAELKSISQQLTNTEAKIAKANEDTIKAVTFAARARERFINGDPKIKRDIFLGLGLHLKLQGKKVQFDTPEYLKTIKQMKTDAPERGNWVAPNNQLVPAIKMEPSSSSIPVWLRGQESHLIRKIMSLPCNFTLPRVVRSILPVSLCWGNLYLYSYALNLYSPAWTDGFLSTNWKTRR